MLHCLRQLLSLAVCFLFLVGCATQSANNLLTQSDTVGAKKQNGADLVKLYLQGKKYQENAQYSEAVSAYEAILAKDPDFVEAHNGLGVIYSVQEKFELALNHLQTAVRLAPLATHLHNNLGYTYFLIGQNEKAIKEFEQSLHLDPDNVKAQFNLSLIQKNSAKSGE